MKNISKILCAAGLAVLVSCQLKDVDNPNITDESFVGTTQSASIWLNGMYRQLALTLNEVVSFTEITSDNYYNNSSLSNKVFDFPTILYSDLDVDNMQRAIGRLTQMADYGLTKIVPADVTSTRDINAEINFLGGYACLLSGELYNALPVTPAGQVVSANECFQKAVAYFNAAAALQTDATKKNGYTLALARAYYGMANRTNALQAAQTIIANAPMLLIEAKYDGINGVSNTMQTYTFSSSTNTYAPLPRLDFLDPKYYHVGTANADQKSIAILKGEEAYLIAAEAMIGSGQLDNARTTLKQLIATVVSNRPTASVNGSQAQRKGNRSDYPLLASVQVKFDASSPARSGFILGRQAGNITVRRVSGTSVTAADLDAATTEDALLYQLCLMRQEIFMSEGRRMTDLGIRFPISQVEMQNNPNVKAEQTQAFIPAYIPGNLGMDNFVYDRTAGVVTMSYDMNKVLVQNKKAAGVLPMLK
jgi:tetratricopeptide (TPR) repeat protein